MGKIWMETPYARTYPCCLTSSDQIWHDNSYREEAGSIMAPQPKWVGP